ncbi:Small glutamine-rich tetratricopeptide repeat-containing protein 2 [Zancudomyces culisetae]|uniref:Small glutamine-rich tetratricopeptide repeat-containing protein 2 n=1 Tax=Zancudomyces culisetae TaxID=1213189 RepID=A0A1R1PVZ0_ZANCU|nr:Small glutamine-rich tetratricopeptide repeat-containing protein 2 [Zancudomyces culisetae]OMH85140.1 Small glutamine-rich tetratricopeptide repeat-containing protein 2 [Zancudomyces culisetae]|eukprot:OMH80630.1 Small glutamine-rich tetratricopeptide repeat-containing protein 2 [Zancudomyces culisetae]
MDKDTVNSLVCGFIQFMDQVSQDPTIVNQEEVEGLEVAKQCLLSAFRLESEDEGNSIHDFSKTSLLEIYESYLSGGIKSAPRDETPVSNARNPEKAEEHKAIGNKEMAAKNYTEAVENYSKAIGFDKLNAIYYANRSAAYCQLNKMVEAQNDAEMAISIDPNYVKAYSRLGHAHFGQLNYEKALEAYNKAKAMDPSNRLIDGYIRTCEDKLQVSESRSAAGAGSGGMGGMPDLSSLLNNPALASMAKNMMGSGALDELSKNPEMSKLADDYRKTGKLPNFNDLMKDPAIMNLANKMASGSSGRPASNPDSGGSANPFGDIMNNPDLMKMASQFMKNGGKPPGN